MKKVLFTTVCRPLGPKHGDAPSVGYELLFGQVTRAQGLFSPRATHVQFSLEYIAQNLDAPTTVLQYPSKRELIRELRKGYDYIGVAFILSTFHKMKEIVSLVRKYAPGTKIVLGGYGTVLNDEELAPYGEYFCREEGVAYMRRLLGEKEKAMPYDHPTVISKLKIFSLPASNTGMVFAGLGCANGCDFCCTSHFFKRKHIRLLNTGKDIYDVMCRYQDEHGIDQFTILDEDFLLNKRRADEFKACVLEGGRTFGIFAFASVRALDRYSSQDLLEMGLDGLWVGYEGTRSGYAKQQGRPPSEIFPEFRRKGISVLASMIVGFDYQDKEVVAEELRGLLRLKPTLTQFLIYGPTPGTPFYDRVVKEERMRPEIHDHKEIFYKNCSGFVSMVKHPNLTKEEIESLQLSCFDRDFQRLGPAMYRSVRVWLNGYTENKRSPYAALRRKSRRFAVEVRKAYPIFLAGRLLAPNARIRKWIAAFERRMHRELGAPTLKERILSVGAVGMALLTRFTLCFDVFQHPRLKPTRHRFDMWQEAFYKLDGVIDVRKAEALARQVRSVLESGRERLVINLESIQWIDRKAMAVFYKRFRQYRGSVRFIGRIPSGCSRRASADLARLIEYFSHQPALKPI